MSENKVVLFIGAFDTKGEEYAYVKTLVERRGHQVITINIGVIDPPRHIQPDWDADQVAEAAGSTIDELRRRGDRGHAMTVMSRGAAKLVRKLYDEGAFHGILGMGGTGGTSVISEAMRGLPIGFPKLIVSTAASGDTRAIVGTKDIALIPSVVDVAGINRISRQIYAEAAGAICGMVEREADNGAEDKPIVAITMFGNTTECVDRCREQLTEAGYECLIFHCTGVGGRTMEDLVLDGKIAAVLDITTTEWADELCGGVFSAGPSRLEAPGIAGIPHLIVPGCIDMANFGGKETVPAQYQDRKLVVWNPAVTLMRTNVEENRRMGEIFAEKANRAAGPVRVLLPLKGVSILDSEGNDFWWPEANQAMFEALKANLQSRIPVEEMDVNINDPSFSSRAVQLMLDMIQEWKSSQSG
ncbi:Tm-1-like ATP-binding domain-containing protein [Paenibacillus sp.]|uniref:Tm-1-like ATP-binding domain-containing protein n=1 Tax=Paenibacillus sp. TaxID=58172 RepID=UPI002D5EDF9B|nr:Tm-1-like ATP-binding domain-containing protein [Paenibacillus sp.]HZG88116.1 Tm-1-like ATP-binding domain-containing protein [Paenibacillus sp.]